MKTEINTSPSVALAGLLAMASLGLSSTHAAAAVPCEELTKLQLPNVALSIKTAAVVPTGKAPPLPFGPTYEGTVPAYCRVDGMIDERIGRNGKHYGIGFAVAMPEQWNGRFLFQGGGGLNGNVGLPLGAAAAGETPALARGFAVVSTDSGHQSAMPFDATFFEDQEATLNFLYQAVGKVTVVAKQIVDRHYGKAAEHSYYVGCSTGGREAMLMSQRYPSYFDGIVAGAPAMRTSYSNLGDRWVAIALNQVAPKDDSGKPVASRAFSESDRKLVVSSLLQACDAKDGLQDGMVLDPLGCDFDPSVLNCKGAKTDQCLTPQQTTALKKAFAGPKDSRGNQVYPGFFYDTGISASGPGTIPGLLAAVPGPIGPPVLPTEIDVDKEAAAAVTPNAAVGDTSHWTNLSTFTGHGGKLLFFHGVSDPWFSAKDTIRYYEQLTADNGGAASVNQWSRLFLVPGMGHCSGGAATLDRFDLLDAAVNWVEKGTAPDAVVAMGKAFPNRTRPLCPYPLHAQYKGQGDREAASSFECRK